MRLKASKNNWIQACRFELFQFPLVANWNYSFTHMLMELRHAVATHQWTCKTCILKLQHFLPAINIFENWSMKNNETKHATLRVFFLCMVFQLYFSFTLKKSRQSDWAKSDRIREVIREGGVDNLYCRNFQVTVFWPQAKGRKFFCDQKIFAGNQI